MKEQSLKQLSEIKMIEAEVGDDTRGILEQLVPVDGLAIGRPLKKEFGSTGMRIEFFEDVPGVSDLMAEEFGVIAPDALVTKGPNGDESEFFETSGKEARETILTETAVDQRQRRVGMPSSLGLGWIAEEPDGQQRLFTEEAEGRRPVMVMPRYDNKFKDGFYGLGPDKQKSIVIQAVEKIMAMEKELQIGEMGSFGGGNGLDGLLKDTILRAVGWHLPEPKNSYGSDVAEKLLGKIEDLYGQEDFVKALLSSEVGNQGGDPRLGDNGYLLPKIEGGWEVIVADPVRLWLKKEDRWTDFHLTPIELQVGLGLASLLMRGEKDLVMTGVEAYKELSERRDSDGLDKLIGLGLVYGVLVDLLVLKNKLLKAGLKIERELENEPTVKRCWQTIESLVKSNMLGWRE